MRWLNQWKRKRDGWVERKRGIQNRFAEKVQESPNENGLDVSAKKVTAAELRPAKDG